jgi:hypothetical protein
MMTLLCCRQWPARCRSLYLSLWLIAVIAGVRQTCFILFMHYLHHTSCYIAAEHRLPCNPSV